MSHPLRWQRSIVAVGVVFAAAFAACSAGSEPAESPTSRPVAASSSTDVASTDAPVATTATTTTTTATATTATATTRTNRTTTAPIPLRSDVAVVNLLPRNTPVDALVPWPDGIGYVRVWGGSRGMVTFPTEAAVPAVLRTIDRRDAYDVVTDDEVQGLLDLQASHGVEIVYLVNINDTLESQLEFIAHLQAVGVHIAMFEMGNELYLPKFATGDLTELGVTRSWTAEEYITLLVEWGPALREIAPTVPIYALAASHGSTTTVSDVSRRGWNDALLAAIDSQPDLFDGVTFHLYVGDPSTIGATATGEEAIVDDDRLDLGFLDTFGDLPVAITESGVRFAPWDPSGPDRSERFWTQLRDALGPRDLFGIHVMFAHSSNVSFALFNDEGRTPVGDRFANWLAGWASPT